MMCVLCKKDIVHNERKYPICVDCICDELFVKQFLAKLIKMQKPAAVEIVEAKNVSTDTRTDSPP